jgi:adiponectin receptor
MQDNPFIHRGYRVDITWRQAFGSMFRLHNETFNVWTHALGFAFMTVLLVAVLTCMPQTKDFAYQHITGASSVNKGLGFVADLFGSGSGAARPVYAYHETMPRFCARYYDRYARFMALRGLSVDDTLPADQYMDGEVVLGPWAFPAQCKPLNHKVFSPSLAERTREYVRSVPEATRRELYRLKQSARRVFASVPLPSSLKSVYRGVADRYSDAKGWAEHQLEQHTANLTARAQETLGQLSSEWDHSVDAAVALYKHLLEHVLPVATAEDARAMKHPAFLAHYLDVGEEYTEDLATWPIVVFVISAMVCFGASAFFHLFSAVSWETYQVLSRMDYAGISLLIGGSNIPIMYYDFYCYQTLKWVYITGISVGCLVTFYITVHPNYVGSRFRVLRTVLFISLGLCGAVPFLHKALLGDFNPVTFAYMMLMGGLYIGGAVIYVTQIPERCLPGRCDIYCSSHQWWHCFVFAATMVHFMGVQYTYHSRIVTPCAPW